MIDERLLSKQNKNKLLAPAEMLFLQSFEGAKDLSGWLLKMPCIVPAISHHSEASKTKKLVFETALEQISYNLKKLRIFDIELANLSF